MAFTDDETIWERYAGLYGIFSVVSSVSARVIQDTHAVSYLKCSYAVLVVAETLLSSR